jgi:hypothetical protein
MSGSRNRKANQYTGEYFTSPPICLRRGLEVGTGSTEGEKAAEPLCFTTSQYFARSRATAVGSSDFFRCAGQPLSKLPFFFRETINRCRSSRFFSERQTTAVGAPVFFQGDEQPLSERQIFFGDGKQPLSERPFFFGQPTSQYRKAQNFFGETACTNRESAIFGDIIYKEAVENRRVLSRYPKPLRSNASPLSAYCITTV